MSDLISRQDAIDAVKRLSLGETDATRLAMRIEDYLERLSSAHPEPERTMEEFMFGQDMGNPEDGSL